MDLGLAGKRALVTGGTRGIGRATVELLAEEGASVAFCARGAEAVEAFAAELEGRGVTVFARAIDVSKEDELKGFIRDAAEALGGLDILVNNVTGGSLKGPEQWQQSLELDLLPLVHLIDEGTPILEAAGGGSIIALSSTFGFDNVWPSSPNSYGAFKAAIVRHASAAAHALAPKGIRVNTVSPGPVYFEDGDWGKIKAGRPEVYEKVLASIPLGRMGQPREVAAVIVSLASPVTGYCVGTNVVCDGGMTVRTQY
jgi:3-oxoacyl-[acyl-carrier protein] reductase